MSRKERDALIDEMRLVLASYGRGEISAATANELVQLLTIALEEVDK